MNMPSSLINVCLLRLPAGQCSVGSVRPSSSFLYRSGFLVLRLSSNVFLNDLFAELLRSKAASPTDPSKKDLLPLIEELWCKSSYFSWNEIWSYPANFLRNSSDISFFLALLLNTPFLLLISFNFLAVGTTGYTSCPFSFRKNSLGYSWTYAGLYSITKRSE